MTAGCAGGDLFAGGVPLRFWNLFGGGDGVNMLAMLDAFRTANPDVNVEASTLAWGPPYYTKLAMAAAGGRAPDVAILHMSRLPAYAPTGLLDPFDLEQLAEAQHGMAHLMKEVGERYHVLYYAAKALNWKLAQYQLNQVIALFGIGATLRPKFSEDLNGFIKTYFQPMSEAIRAQDWRIFEEAFKKGIQGSDQFHEKYGYGYIHFVLPKNPPEMYDLTPRE